MEKRLIVILSISLTAALLVIAFQAGRLSVKTNAPTPQTAAVTASENRTETAPISPPVTAPVSAPPVEQRAAPADKERPPSPFPAAPQAPLPLPHEERANAPHGAPETGSSASIASY